MYKNYGLTWRNQFFGYLLSGISTLPRVTSETGYPIGGEVTEEIQAHLFMNLYLSQFKQGWSHTAIYLLLQKSISKFYLVIWGERFTGGSDEVTVNLGKNYRTVNIYDPTIGISALRTLNKISSLKLTMSDHPIIIGIDD